ncbi:hypothetical protein Taro_034524 [Colocasia esculenta]|uniref:Uncharacterized protein n=1 Tax=Colocasia esculenta TaxID=4460 RepID=A0A843VWL6_COLES|nr:hypothetical protein [Colocasia esculenta]
MRNGAKQDDPAFWSIRRPLHCRHLEGDSGAVTFSLRREGDHDPVAFSMRRVLLGEEKGSYNFFMWCDDFLALGPSCSGKCECNRDAMMQKLVEENEILRKRTQELQLQLEKKTRITTTLGRWLSTDEVRLSTIGNPFS